MLTSVALISQPAADGSVFPVRTVYTIVWPALNCGPGSCFTCKMKSFSSHAPGDCDADASVVPIMASRATTSASAMLERFMVCRPTVPASRTADWLLAHLVSCQCALHDLD